MTATKPTETKPTAKHLAVVTTIVLDCADPAPLADFYRAVTGWTVAYRDDDCVHLSNGDGVRLGFQRVDGYRAPGWPDAGKQAHLDLTVSDLNRAVTQVLAVGAAKPEFQPGGDDWVVLTDPAGHPFCLITGD